MNEILHHFGVPLDVAHGMILVGGVGLFMHALVCLGALFVDIFTRWGDECR